MHLSLVLLFFAVFMKIATLIFITLVSRTKEIIKSNHYLLLFSSKVLFDVMSKGAYDRTGSRYPEGYVDLTINFTLNTGSIMLMHEAPDKSLSPIVKMIVSVLTCGVSRRPHTGAFEVSAELHALHVHDLMTLGSLFPVLISPKKKDAQAILDTSAVEGSFEQRGPALFKGVAVCLFKGVLLKVYI